MPVYLDPKVFDLHYNGFCNSVLWQLFHYVPLNMDSKLSETRTLQVSTFLLIPALIGSVPGRASCSRFHRVFVYCIGQTLFLLSLVLREWDYVCAVPVGSPPGGKPEVWGGGVAELLCWGCGVGPGLPPHATACHFEEPRTQNEGVVLLCACHVIHQNLPSLYLAICNELISWFDFLSFAYQGLSLL